MQFIQNIRKHSVLLILGVITLGLLYWFVCVRGIETTDDAYLKGNITILSPRIAGYVTEVQVQDNQRVQKGDVIAKIDPKEYQARLGQAQAEVESLNARLNVLDNQSLAQEQKIKTAQADMQTAKAALARAEKEFKRTSALIKDGAISEQINEQATFEHEKGLAAMQKSQAQYEAANIELKMIQAQQEEAKAQYQKAEAMVRLAELEVSYTTVVAPKNGVIGNKGVQVGQLARPGLAMAYLIPDQEIWVEANFKETQVGKMKPGQPVKITIDAFPGKTFHGQIDSLAPASGSEFSILPPENATGNFTKIVRRVPVKITFAPETDLLLLKPGLSSIVHVNVR